MLGSLLSAGSSLIGGLLGNKAEKKERAMQLEFAQNGIQWKVADAKKAGIHPLFALGAPTQSYSPISTGSLGDAVSNMGQDLGRAADAVRKPVQKVDAYVAKLQALQLERGSLENQLLRAQIINENRVPGQAIPFGAGQASVIPGQSAGAPKVLQNRRLVPDNPIDPQRTKGMNIGVGYKTNPSFVDVQALEDRYGDNIFVNYGGALANALADAYYNAPSGEAIKRAAGRKIVEYYRPFARRRHVGGGGSGKGW